MRLTARVLGVIVLGSFVASCSLFPVGGYDNEKTPADPKKRKIGQFDGDEVESGGHIASLEVPWNVDLACRNTFPRTLNLAPGKTSVNKWPAQDCPRAREERFVGMALSGGGSRAAIFSAASMFELERYGILQQVDVISSVSGGSYTAGLYALSCDPGQGCPPTVENTRRPEWSETKVYALLETDFISSWIWHMFAPDNIARFWLTDFSRSQIMASTLDSNLFDTSRLGGEGFRFHDLNLQRPNLLINATDFSDHLMPEPPPPSSPYFRQASDPASCRVARFFAFSQEVFRQIGSSLDQYRIADAVVASSAFPGEFNDVNLRDYTVSERYVHLFDAGPFDNLGLAALHCVIERGQPPGRPLVILVDAYVAPEGKSVRRAGTKGFSGHFIDLNALDAVDVMFEGQRKDTIAQFAAATHARLMHITFQNLADDPALKTVYTIANETPTDLSIKPYQANCLKIAARILVSRKVQELRSLPASEGLADLIPPNNRYVPDLSQVGTCQVSKEDLAEKNGG
jgi:predicted acylesterase/phospholipase RssA